MRFILIAAVNRCNSQRRPTTGHGLRSGTSDRADRDTVSLTIFAGSSTNLLIEIRVVEGDQPPKKRPSTPIRAPAPRPPA